MHRASHRQPSTVGSYSTWIQSIAVSSEDHTRTTVLAVLLNNGQVVWWQYLPSVGNE